MIKVGIYFYILFLMGFFLNNLIILVVGLKIEWFFFLDGSYDWLLSILVVFIVIIFVILLLIVINKGM